MTDGIYTGTQSAFVLFDYDQRQLATRRVYTDRAEAAVAADHWRNVIVLELAAAASLMRDGDSDDDWDDDEDEEPADELCDCQLPGRFYSGVPGILACVVNGRLASGAKIERCDGCQRYDSDAEARNRLIELGIAPASEDRPSG